MSASDTARDIPGLGDRLPATQGDTQISVWEGSRQVDQIPLNERAIRDWLARHQGSTYAFSYRAPPGAGVQVPRDGAARRKRATKIYTQCVDNLI